MDVGLNVGGDGDSMDMMDVDSMCGGVVDNDGVVDIVGKGGAEDDGAKGRGRDQGGGNLSVHRGISGDGEDANNVATGASQ